MGEINQLLKPPTDSGESGDGADGKQESEEEKHGENWS